jgi:LacI family transcriptional regulator
MPRKQPSPRRKRAKIDDVARAVGVHASTVSRVLNPRTAGRVSEAVAKRVRAAARRLGYAPDPIASGLRTRRSSMVGVVVPDIANPVFPLILRGIEAELAAAGYTAIVANTDNDPRRASEILDRLAARRVDGVILATATYADDLAGHCRALALPVALVNRAIDGDALSAVVNDDEAGIALAVAHLAAQGHRAIGHVAGPQSLSTGRARRKGFAAAMKARGLPAGRWAAADSFEIDAGARACAKLLATAPDVTAIVAANDLLALGCYDELARRGLRCPQDVSVTGYNDMAFADRFAPPLTSVRIAHRRMGEEAARLLVAEIGDASAPRRRIRLAPELVVRGSTAPPRARSATARARP